MCLTAGLHILGRQYLPKRCIRHGEGHAEADAALEGGVNGVWLVGDQHHDADVTLQMMQQHTYNTTQCCRFNIHFLTASVLTPSRTLALELITAYFVDMLSLGEPNADAQKRAKHSFVLKGHTLSWLHAVYSNGPVSVLTSYFIAWTTWYSTWLLI